MRNSLKSAYRYNRNKKEIRGIMSKRWKHKVAKATGSNYKLNKKIMQLKRSWDEVEAMLNGSVKRKKK